MKKMKNKFFRYLLLVILTIIVSVIGLYTYIGYQFGKGVSRAADTVIEIKKDFKNDSINRLDSIKKNVTNILDAINNDTLHLKHEK